MQREKGMTVGVWAEQWFTQRVGKWSPNTEGGYRNLIYNHIIPGVGRARLTDLTARRIQSFYKRLTQKGLGPGAYGASICSLDVVWTKPVGRSRFPLTRHSSALFPKRKKRELSLCAWGSSNAI